MGYIGNQTSNSYTSLDKQVITGDGGASYTLDHAVANENEIEVFVNNVRQEPSVAYSVSNTTLSMTGNVQASDDFYVVFQGKAIQTVTPPSSSVTTDMIVNDAVTTAKLNDDAVTTAKLDDDAVTTEKMAADARSPILQVKRSSFRTAANTTTSTTMSEIHSAYRVAITPKSSTSEMVLEFQAGFGVGSSTYLGIDFMVGTTSDYNSMSRIDTNSVNETFRNASTSYLVKRLTMRNIYDGYSNTDTLYFTMYYSRPNGSSTARVNDNTGRAFLTVTEVEMA